MVTLMPYLESGATIPRPVDLDDTDHLIDTHRQVFFLFFFSRYHFFFLKKNVSHAPISIFWIDNFFLGLLKG